MPRRITGAVLLLVASHLFAQFDSVRSPDL